MAKKKPTMQERFQLARELAGWDGTPVWPPLSRAARKRIEAEVSARWPYYKKSKEYRALAQEMKELECCLAAGLEYRLAPWPPITVKIVPQKEYSAFAQSIEEACRNICASLNLPILWKPEMSEIADKMDLVSKKVLEQFGMLDFIPIEASVEDILECEPWSTSFFPTVFLPAYSDVRGSIPDERESKIRYLLKQASSLPVQLNLLRSKGEVLVAVEGIIDAWQDRMKEAGISLGSRHREPDYSLFPVYVEAYALREQGKSLKQIRDRLFPGEDAVAAERKTELYILNGRHLIRGQSDRIGQR